MNEEKPSRLNPKIAAAALALGLVAGGYGVASAVNDSSVSATTPKTMTVQYNGAAGGSSEDPAHEANESAAHEAEEHSGNWHGGRGGSNEDPAHEAAESAEREAEEHANGGAGGSNEDPAHETAESAEREAQENAAAGRTCVFPSQVDLMPQC